MDIPRRICIDKLIPAETAVREATLAVEALPAHPLLTDAVILLEQARHKIADWYDGHALRPAAGVKGA